MVVLLLQLNGCGFNRFDDYILKNPGALDPKISKNARYITQRFDFLAQYEVSHEWPLGFNICKYTTIDLPESEQDGTWHGSYNRLGSVFEYKGKTLQERRTNGYPERSVDIRYLSKDNYFRSNKVLTNKGKQEEHGFESICHQTFIRSNMSLDVELTKRTKKQILGGRYQVINGEVIPDKEIINETEWTVIRYKLKRPKGDSFIYLHEEWILPIADTDYTYSFLFLANTESKLFPKEYKRLKRIFRHLIESVKIEKLGEDEATKARAHVASIIKGIEIYEASIKKRK